MARRRYLSTEISVDRAVNRVAVRSDFAALLYTWMIPHAEEDGTITADPEELLWVVMPGRRDKSPNDIAEALRMLEEELIVVSDGLIYFPHESFYKYQTNVSAERRRERTPARNSTEQHRTAQNSASFSPSPSPSPSPSESLVHRTPKTTAPPNGFSEWWAMYPRKQGKGQARRAYAAALKKVKVEILRTGLEVQLPELCAKEAQYIPMPATWLNGERWGDVLDTIPDPHLLRIQRLRELRERLGDGAVEAMCETQELWQEVCGHE